jgi:hypothetical protein
MERQQGFDVERKFLELPGRDLQVASPHVVPERPDNRTMPVRIGPGSGVNAALRR